MRQTEPVGDARRDPDRPVDSRRDQSGGPLGHGEPLDSRLVLDGDDRATVGIAKPRRGRIAVEGDHVQPTLASSREQPELGRPRP